MASNGLVRIVGSVLFASRGELLNTSSGLASALKATSVLPNGRHFASSSQAPEDAFRQRPLDEPEAASLAASLPETAVQTPSTSAELPAAELLSEVDVSLQVEGLDFRLPRVAPLPEDLVPEVQPAVLEEAEPSRRRGLGEDGIPLPQFVPSQAAGKAQKGIMGLAEAIKLVKGSTKAKFDETMEVHVNLSIDPRRGDQMVRGAATLPHGIGKAVRVAVFAEGAAAQEALAAGADVVGAEDLVARVKESGGKLDFDKCIATPALMPKLGQVARILGPRGLMPNPKVGTVTNAVGEAVKAAKRGRVDFRADKTGIVHAGVGKASFTEAALEENIAAFAAALLDSKPAGLKKSSKFVGYFNSFSLSSTMGQGVRVNIQSVANAADGYIRARATG